ncbi:hypothetical protein ACEPPN_010873 [Leptodophora sp. 'Broadleaf-Isolate-01']
MALKTTESPSLGETNKSTSSRSAKADAPPVRDEEVPVASIFNREGKTLSEIWHEILNEGLWSLRVCLDHRTEELAKGDYDTVAKWNFYRIYYLLQDETKRLRILDWKSAGLDNVRLNVFAVAVIAIKHIDKAVAKIEEEAENSA